MQNTDLTSAFSALSDPVRFAIVEQLLTDGEQSAGDIGLNAPVSAPAVSRHLKVLRTAGLVRQRVDAQRRMYSVDPAAIRKIHAWTLTYRDFWEASLDRLAQVLEEEDNV